MRTLPLASVLSILAAGGFAGAPVAAATGATRGVCSLMARDDVAHFTGWEIASVSKRRYSIQGATGRMCTIESSQGNIFVILPDAGMPFPDAGAASSNGSLAAVTSHFSDRGIPVSIYRGTAFFALGSQDVAVRMVPTDHDASNAEVEPLARALIARAGRKR